MNWYLNYRLPTMCNNIMLETNMIGARQIYVPYANVTSNPATYKIQ